MKIINYKRNVFLKHSFLFVMFYNIKRGELKNDKTKFSNQIV